MKFGNQNISNIIIASSFKRGQLIKDNQKIIWLNVLKTVILFL